MPRKKYQVEQLKQRPIAWQLLHFAMTKLFKQTHSWFSLHQTGDELKSLLIHLPSRECFPRWHQVWQKSQWWVSHSHPSVRAGVWGLPDQETLGRWHSGDTSIKRIKWHPYKPQDLWKILTFLMTRLQKANFARQISAFNSPPSYKNPNILFCFSTAFRLHNQRSARNMFYCAYKLCMKYLNIQSASGQVSGSFNALFINE